MARVDYFAIEEAIKTVLASSADLANVDIFVEEQVQFGIEAPGGWITIFGERRDPTTGQSLSMGQRTRYTLRFSIWVWCYNIDGVREAVKARDALLGKVEVVLLQNPTLGGVVNRIYLGGGELPSGALPSEIGGFVSGGEIVVLVEAVATT